MVNEFNIELVEDYLNGIPSLSMKPGNINLTS